MRPRLLNILSAAVGLVPSVKSGPCSADSREKIEKSMLNKAHNPNVGSVHEEMAAGEGERGRKWTRPIKAEL